jgi:hypothetical protein
MVFSLEDTKRHGFSLNMELLATIPKAPRYAKVRDLVRDFDFGSQAECRRLLAELRTYGVAVTFTRGDGWIAYVGYDSWLTTENACIAYYATVYRE